MTHPLSIVRTNSGSLRWEIRDADGRLVYRYATRKLATATLVILHGDRSTAPTWYRLVLASAERIMPRRSALQYAMGHASDLGLGPVEVAAEPTGEPKVLP